MTKPMRSTFPNSSRWSLCRAVRATSCRSERWPAAEIYQAYIGSSANPGLRDFAVAALMVDGAQVPERVSFDVNPTSRQILENLASMGLLQKLIASGARIHQAGCNGCIGMGQAPATGKISLRTVPAQFPRSLRNQGGQGLPVQPGDRGSLGSDRRHHRPPHAEYGLSPIRRTGRNPDQYPNAPEARRPGRHRRIGKRT